MKIVLDAGHGLSTAGKQTPDGEKEWSFNNVVLLAAQTALQAYPKVQILRVDDPTGKTDIPLSVRTRRANAWKGDLYLSFHHNAYLGRWGEWGGVETYTFNGKGANPLSAKVAKLIHPRVVIAMQLRDRGLKKKNLHVLRETRMPAVLIEGGFMDSLTDIRALRSQKKLQAQGVAIAEAVAEYAGLNSRDHTTNKEQVNSSSQNYKVVTGIFRTQREAESAASKLRSQFGWTVHVKKE